MVLERLLNSYDSPLHICSPCGEIQSYSGMLFAKLHEWTIVVQGFRKWSFRFIRATLWICWLSFLIIHLRCVQREIYSQDILLECTYWICLVMFIVSSRLSLSAKWLTWGETSFGRHWFWYIWSQRAPAEMQDAPSQQRSAMDWRYGVWRKRLICFKADFIFSLRDGAKTCVQCKPLFSDSKMYIAAKRTMPLTLLERPFPLANQPHGP